MRDASRSPKAAHTIAELLVVLSLAGIVLSIAVPRAKLALDRVSVDAATSEVAAIFGKARILALASHEAVAVTVTRRSGVVQIRRGVEVILSRPVGRTHSVELTSTRDSLSYDARGLGRGAANLSVIVRRGSAAETVFVSRLGRIR